MAENILGILFVTSTSRGRNVFRYPPDPLSPLQRLNQPVFPSSTFTARDNIFGDTRRTRLFPEQHLFGSTSASGTVDRRISGTTYLSGTRRSGQGGLGRPFGDSDGGRSDLKSFGEGVSNGGLRYDDGVAEEDDDDWDSDATDNSDREAMPKSNRRDHKAPLSGRRIEEEIIKGSREQRGTEPKVGEDDRKDRGRDGQIMMETGSRRTSLPRNGNGNGSLDPKANGRQSANDQEREKEQDRNPSHSSVRDSGAVPSNPSNSTSRKASVRQNNEEIENQYNYALSYSLDFLSDMLTPPRSACNRQFEICVDALVFLGHPVTIGQDGTWSFPAEAGGSTAGSMHVSGHNALRPTQEDVERSRGRRREAVGHSHLRTVIEGPESTPGTNQINPINLPPAALNADARDAGKGNKDGNEDDCPTLNMFHMVIILDKPDPKTASTGEINQSSNGYEEVYREIAFKWTAAAYALQVRDNWVARESWEMAKARERFMMDRVPIEQCTQSLYRTNPLERALQDLAFALWKFRSQPVNPLYSHLPSNVTVSLAGMPLNMVLSTQNDSSYESWACWGTTEHDAESDISSDSDDIFPTQPDRGGIGGRELVVDPWKTLLLLDDETKSCAKEVANAVVGSGGDWTPIQVGRNNEPDDSPLVGLNSRRGSKETQAEADESNLMKALIEACDVSRNLEDIAHNLRFDLEGIVVPLARELVQNKKAILIDVVNIRMRTLVIPTTITDHITSLDDYTILFTHAFPTLPTLPAYISQISASPTPFRDIIPSELASDITSRQVYLDSLIWLLKHDLLLQVHTRVRIWARPEIKEKAWRKLWARRRQRWLNSRAGSMRGSDSIHSSSASVSISSGNRTGDHFSDDLITPRAERGENPMAASIPPPQYHATLSRFDDSGTSSYTNLGQSFMDYDPELELDSDVGEGDSGGFKTDIERLDSMQFTMDRTEPTAREIPPFEGSFILRPARAIKEEMRWLRTIREAVDEVWASKFDLSVQYFDGQCTFEEISYRTKLPMRELATLVNKLFKDDVVVLLHP